ncbi:DNA topoisomerase IB [Streptomyces sp. DSM 44917]|uniref:DNA topoisomerase n=1 Tax=Streptomyces boetiae TaxID=3075541 RepID=A0ABU2LGL5_9ACTN|nr:DNA topoisomerase IB [Streptomyces sp. DSM 44917]MDT0310378.1 DNA topoisomerase IB [Streptomyces sp. DSM 44917]
MRLRHVRPTDPGYLRKRHGRGFRYLDADGGPLRDDAELERIRGLVIPPAWREVWICPDGRGHLQAVGTDAAGRRQYLYHEEFRAAREQAKHAHVLEVAEALPRIRAATARALRPGGLTEARVLGAAVRLLDMGFFRIGSQRYADRHQTYGLTTLHRAHLRCGRGGVTFTYPGKHGRERVQTVADPEVCRVLTALRSRRGDGERLLAYWRRPSWHEVTGEELNAHLKALGGLDITAKDFRTWHGTVLAAVGLAVSGQAAGTEAARRRSIARAVREAADYLGNTPAVCRASYINPRVIELYEEGVTVEAALPRLGDAAPFGAPATQGPVEAAVLRMLRTGRPPGR